MVEIVYETHSTTTDNERGIATGWGSGRLSERGRLQARRLGERRRDDGLAAVFVSDLGRALETVEIAFAGSGLPVHRDARLRECNYGVLNGAPAARLAADRSRHVETPYPGGQSYRDVERQMREFLRDLDAGWRGARVAVVGHSANRLALDSLLGGADLAALVDAPFHWREGWTYVLPTGWTGG